MLAEAHGWPRPAFTNDPVRNAIATLSVHPSEKLSCLSNILFDSVTSSLGIFSGSEIGKKKKSDIIGMATSTLPHAVAQSYGLFRKESPPPGCKWLFRFFCVFICKIYSFSPSLFKSFPLRIHIIEADHVDEYEISSHVRELQRYRFALLLFFLMF